MTLGARMGVSAETYKRRGSNVGLQPASSAKETVRIDDEDESEGEIKGKELVVGMGEKVVGWRLDPTKPGLRPPCRRSCHPNSEPFLQQLAVPP